MRHEEDHGEHEGNHERWLVTYSDMITLLMAFFIMMYSMSRVDLAKFSAMATSVRAEFAGTGIGGAGDMSLLNESVATSFGIVDGTCANLRENVEKGLKKQLGAAKFAGSVEVLEIDGNLVIRLIDNAVLFEPGSARLTNQHKDLLRHVAGMVRILPYSVRIEGHTDSVPINTAAFPSNWELSTVRATNVVLCLIRELGISPDKLSAVGYADTRPVATNTTPANRQKNRRIDIVVFTQQMPSNAVTTSQVAEATGGKDAAPIQGIVPKVDITGAR